MREKTCVVCAIPLNPATIPANSATVPEISEKWPDNFGITGRIESE